MPGEDIDANIRRNVRVLSASLNIRGPTIYRQLGLSRQTYSGRLNGTTKFSAAELLKVAAILGVTAEHLGGSTTELIGHYKFSLYMRPDLRLCPDFTEPTQIELFDTP